MCNKYSHLELFASGFLVQFGRRQDKCSVEVSIGRDRIVSVPTILVQLAPMHLATLRMSLTPVHIT